MAETTTTTTTQPEDKKTVVAFIVGLLIGGLLVWAFSGPAADAPDRLQSENENATSSARTDDADDTPLTTTENDSESPAVIETAVLPTGEGRVEIGDIKAGQSVPISDITYPIDEGWIGVRNYQNESLGYILGVVRFSKSQGLVPDEIVLQTPTRAGLQYAIVMFTENGDRIFSLAEDKQVDQVFATFTAQ
jgi:hypothetical protein